MHDRAALLQAARGGLCGGCRWARAIPSGRGAVFLRCDHPDTPKYPPMPVVRCAAFTPVALHHDAG